MTSVVGLGGGGRHFKFQGLPGIVSLTNSGHAEGEPCARTWCALREEDINPFPAFPFSLLTLD